MKYLKDSGIKIFGASEKARDNYYETDFALPAALAMGSEEKGLSASISGLCDQLVGIPMKGEIESLNVSVAAGIILFEANRQRDL